MHPFPTFFKTGTTNETFQQSGKQDSFQHRLEISASMYENSGSQFFKTTTEIQSGFYAFDKSRLFMTFLTNFRVTEILCSFGLVLQGKQVKRYLKKFLASNFSLSYAENNMSGLLNREGIADLPLLRTLLAICHEPSFQEVVDFVLLAKASLTASITLLQ